MPKNSNPERPKNDRRCSSQISLGWARPVRSSPLIPALPCCCLGCKPSPARTFFVFSDHDYAAVVHIASHAPATIVVVVGLVTTNTCLAPCFWFPLRKMLNAQCSVVFN